MEVEGGREENNGWSGRKGRGEESWGELRKMEVEERREERNLFLREEESRGREYREETLPQYIYFTY
jgi:hypothetical protein